jgi:hypothetical protein
MGGQRVVDRIPFSLQGREGLGFFASVNLGLDAGSFLVLSLAGRKLIGTHVVAPLRESTLLTRIALGELGGQWRQGLKFLTIQGYLLWLTQQRLSHMKDNYHGSPFNEISGFSHGLDFGYTVPFGSLGNR